MMWKKVISLVKNFFKPSATARKSKKRAPPRQQKSRKSPRKKLKITHTQKNARPIKTIFKKIPTAKANKTALKQTSQTTTQKASASPEAVKVFIGPVTHFFDRIQVAVIDITGTAIKVGDQILIKGKAGSFSQKVVSLQVESKDVASAAKGVLVGLKLNKPARVGDQVFKLK